MSYPVYRNRLPIISTCVCLHSSSSFSEAKNNNLLSGTRLLQILTLHAARVEECFITENRLLLQSLPSTRTIRVNRWGSRQKLRSPMNYTEMTAKCFPNGPADGGCAVFTNKVGRPQTIGGTHECKTGNPPSLPFNSRPLLIG